MINHVWVLLIGLGIGTALVTGKTAVITPTIFNNANQAIQFTLGLAGLMAFWSGILKVADAAGITKAIAKFLRPFLQTLFPTLKKEPQILGLISLTLAANMLGLGNVATPLGLQTISELQKLNPETGRASDEICTFLALVLGGLTLIPTTLIAIRVQTGSQAPTVVLGPILIVSLCGSLVALGANYLALKTKCDCKRG